MQSKIMEPLGSMFWTRGLNGTVFASPALVNGNTAAGSVKGVIVLFNGASLWRDATTYYPRGIYSSFAAGSNNVMYCATSAGAIFALEPYTGATIGGLALSGFNIVSSPVINTMVAATPPTPTSAMHPRWLPRWFPTRVHARGSLNPILVLRLSMTASLPRLRSASSRLVDPVPLS